MGATKNFMDVVMQAPKIDASGNVSMLGWTPHVITKSASFTVPASASGTIYVAKSQTAALTFTLPAISEGPFVFFFFNATDLSMVVASAADNTFIIKNDVTGGSVTFNTTATRVGAGLMVVCDGTSLFGVVIDGTATIA